MSHRSGRSVRCYACYSNGTVEGADDGEDDPASELRNNSSAILREVAGGESFAITNNGEVVALLVPPTGPSSPPLRRRAARVHGGFAELARAGLDHPVQEDLDALRGDR